MSKTSFAIIAGALSMALGVLAASHATAQETVFVSPDGNVGLRTSTPAAPLHIYGSATADAWIGLGPSPAYGSGPAMNIGYGGASFGRGAGYIFVRPDASATAPNPSLRFATADVVRMIITNTGNVGIGTTSPGRSLEVARSGVVDLALYNSSSTHAGGGAANPTRWFIQTDNDPNRTFKISREGGGGSVITVDARQDANGVTFKVDGSVQATNVVFSSSRSLKEDIRPLDPQEVLARVANLPIAEWRFKEGPEQVRHIGPMAEDFHDAFGLSPSRETISVTDTSGVALAAIQGLHQRIEELEKQNAALMRRLQAVEKTQAPSSEP